MARDYTKNRRDNRQYQKGAITASAEGGRHSNRYSRDAEGRQQGYEKGRVGDRDRSERGRNERGRGRDDNRRDKNGPAGEIPEGILIGRNPVMEALKSGRTVHKLMVADGSEGSVRKIAAMARDAGVTVQYVDRIALDRASGGGQHQGVVAQVSDYEYAEVSDILAKAADKGQAPFIIILDGIEDPHNLGAIIRTADASGAHGVIIPKRRAAAVTAVAERTAAGAASYVPVARVTNIGQTIDELKSQGVWVAAVDMDGELYTRSDFTGPIAFVTGSEGSGISRLVKEKCDFCVSIPMLGGVNSLNASNAAAVLMYEAVRQRNL